MPRFVYSPSYAADIGDHVFPTAKFRLAAEVLRREGLARDSDFVEPGPPPREDLLLAHDAGWVDRALSGKLALADETRLELQWSPELAAAHSLAVSGTLLACRHALESGAGLHVGGGAHHAFRDHGEGFCALNDVAVALLRLGREGRIRRAAVVDLDVHQGNGTNAILGRDAWVLTFSMHQANAYPFPNWTPGAVDVEVEPGTGDSMYLDLLERHLPAALDRHGPELIVYLAGADVFAEDRLGGLALTRPGILERDRKVLGWTRSRGIPVAVVLGGGYARNLSDTVAIHVATLEAAAEAFGLLGRKEAETQ